MFDINFDKSEPQIICHSQYQELVPTILQGLSSYNLKDHFILFSSGTTGGVKGYAISKEALFANAKASNEHFKMTKDDVWALSLPVYHIGGLSVLARARLLGNKIIDARHWNPESWPVLIGDATITTIVPTQLYDLVKRGIKAPPKLKYIIVGGDFLSSKLKEKALKLGWPVIRTFGMSEVCSQLASAKHPASDEIELFPIHQVKIGDDQRLLVKSQALFTLQFVLSDKLHVTMAKELCDNEGFYKTSDRAEFTNGHFKHLGRLGDEYKIAGHLVNLLQLKDTLSSFLHEKDLFGKMEFQIEDDERKGKKLVLYTLPSIHSDLVKEVSKLVAPVKIDVVKVVENFERTALGKLKVIRNDF